MAPPRTVAVVPQHSYSYSAPKGRYARALEAVPYAHSKKGKLFDSVQMFVGVAYENEHETEEFGRLLPANR